MDIEIIKDLVSKNMFKTAINETLSRWWDNYSANYSKLNIFQDKINDIVFISSTYNQLNRDYLMGIVNFSDVQIEKNKLVKLFINVLDEIEILIKTSGENFLIRIYTKPRIQQEYTGIDLVSSDANLNEVDTPNSLGLKKYIFLLKGSEFFDSLEPKTRYDISHLKSNPMGRHFLAGKKGRRSDAIGSFEIGQSLKVVDKGINQDKEEYYKVEHPSISNKYVFVPVSVVTFINPRLIFELSAGPYQIVGYLVLDWYGGKGRIGGSLSEVEIIDDILGNQKINLEACSILEFTNGTVNIHLQDSTSEELLIRHSGKIKKDCWLISKNQKIKLNQKDKSFKMIRLNQIK